MPRDLYEGYPAQPTTPALARAAIATYLAKQGLDELIPTAALLVSEVVTNAVLHGGEPITLRATVTGDVLHVDVDDPSDVVPHVRDAPTDRGGRGHHIVTALATDWGAEPRNGVGSGKTTWFELRF